MVEAAKEKYRQQGTNAIVAIGKGDTWEMTKETYTDKHDLDLAIRRYRNKGMQVKTVRV
jgi:hypothetical protein